MKLKRVIAAIILVSAFAAPVAAGTFEDAVDAHARGEGEQRAVKTLEMAERRMTLTQINEAQKLARDWKPATQTNSSLKECALRPVPQVAAGQRRAVSSASKRYGTVGHIGS